MQISQFSDMTDKDDVGVTVISHDSESRTLVYDIWDPGTYSRDAISYDAGLH